MLAWMICFLPDISTNLQVSSSTLADTICNLNPNSGSADKKKIPTVLYSNCRTVWTWKLLLLQFYAWTSFPSRFLSQTFCCKTYWRKELFEQGTCRGFCGRRPQRPWSPAWEHWGRPSSLATLILMFSEMLSFYSNSLEAQQWLRLASEYRSDFHLWPRKFKITCLLACSISNEI